MAIPSINKILSPLLTCLESGEPRPPHEVLDHICKEFGMTDDEMNMRNASGTNTKIKNRVVWAKMSLKQAGLLAVHPAGGWMITDLGVEKVRSGFRPNIRNIKPLARARQDASTGSADAAEPWRSGCPDRGEGGTGAAVYVAGDDEGPDSDQTPYERIDTAVRELREDVLDDILEKAKRSKPHYFERIVVDLLEKMGYGKGATVGGSGDRGIDGVLVMDRLGFDMIFVQAKRSAVTIDSKAMREFVGALDPQKSKKGVFITTSDFSQEALAVVDNTRNPIVAINGRRLAELMYDHNVGCEVDFGVEIKRVDEDYFRG